MQQDLKLSSGEQKLEWTLLVIVFVFLLVIIAGIISQSKGVNYDYLLTPLFFFSGGLCFVLLGFNGLAKKQLVEKCIPDFLSSWIKVITRLIVSKDHDKKNDAWKVSFGLLAISTGFICWITAFYDLYKHL